MIVVSIEKVPRSLMKAEWGKDEDAPLGLTIYPEGNEPPFKGMKRVRIMVAEKQSQYLTREIICHELLHLAQFCCGCEVEESVTHELEDILVHGMKEKKKH